MKRLNVAAGLVASGLFGAAALANPSLPVTPAQRSTAQQVAQAGVALSELAPNAPDAHTVQRGDTLWSISTLFLKSPWRWPELWGMNLEQIRNPHLIYPGQVLVLDKSDGRARLRVASSNDGLPAGTVKLSPRVREELLENGAIASVPMSAIGPFLNEGIVVEAGALEAAPRIVATQENRVLLSRGETAYVRGDRAGATNFRLFREPRALVDPDTRQVLGFEGVYVGTARFVREGQSRPGAEASPFTVPDTFAITHTKLDAQVGDRLAPVVVADVSAFAPRAPAQAISGRVISIYGEALVGGQNHVVALNKGRADGLERGHVLALWRSGTLSPDRSQRNTRNAPETLQLPDERQGLAFVFRVFERTAYALVLNVQGPVNAGDRFTQP
jgi:hypothetical protein